MFTQINALEWYNKALPRLTKDIFTVQQPFRCQFIVTILSNNGCCKKQKPAEHDKRSRKCHKSVMYANSIAFLVVEKCVQMVVVNVWFYANIGLTYFRFYFTFSYGQAVGLKNKCKYYRLSTSPDHFHKGNSQCHKYQLWDRKFDLKKSNGL